MGLEPCAKLHGHLTPNVHGGVPKHALFTMCTCALRIVKRAHLVACRHAHTAYDAPATFHGDLAHHHRAPCKVAWASDAKCAWWCAQTRSFHYVHMCVAHSKKSAFGRIAMHMQRPMPMQL